VLLDPKDEGPVRIAALEVEDGEDEEYDADYDDGRL
jgi:hypothetical protein